MQYQNEVIKYLSILLFEKNITLSPISVPTRNIQSFRLILDHFLKNLHRPKLTIAIHLLPNPTLIPLKPVVVRPFLLTLSAHIAVLHMNTFMTITVGKVSSYARSSSIPLSFIMSFQKQMNYTALSVIKRRDHVVGLILTYHINFGLPLRKTATISH